MLSDSPFSSVWYSLNFETMEVEDEDDPPKYACVRQLTNSDSPLRNPYFPNKWKFYWWNNFSWTEYSEVSVSNVSLFLLEVSAGAPSLFSPSPHRVCPPCCGRR